MAQQLSLEKSYIISIWLEALVYGIFLCLFCASLYVNISLRKMQDCHSRIIFTTGIVMFIIATIHLAMNCFRMIRGYVDFSLAPGGAVGYIANIRLWEYIFKDLLYATQEILGEAVAIYRCWILWDHSYKIVLLPCCMLIVSIFSSYRAGILYRTVSNAFQNWVVVFYSLAVVQNVIVTILIGYRVWSTEKRTANIRASHSNLLPILRIFIESASLQVIAEIMLLGLYVANINARIILLEIVTPLVGITFSAITIRIALHTAGGIANGSNSRGYERSESNIETIGRLPMRRLPVNMCDDVEVQGYPHIASKGHKDALALNGTVSAFEYRQDVAQFDTRSE